MKVERVWRGVLACLVLTALFAPPSAVAKPGYETEPKGLILGMSLKGSNGYRVSVITFPGRFVLLEATKDGTRASYIVRGRVTNRSLDASFGRLGRISVTFHSTRTKLQPTGSADSDCKGRRALEDLGRFEGVIRFAGEERFTEVDATRAKGYVSRSFRRVCRAPSSAGRDDRHSKVEQGPRETALLATARSGRRSVSMLASGGPESIFWASLTEQREGMSINRAAMTVGRLGTFVMEPAGAVNISPPHPFSGTATYTMTPGSAVTWDGSLSAPFPGAGDVELTGPDFAAVLCRDMLDRELFRCLFRAAAPSPRTSGS